MTGTQSGKVLRLRNKGLPSVNSYGTGDLLINIKVYVPEKLTAEERKKIESLAASANFTPDISARERAFRSLRDFED